jgi:hypothetical protein
MDIRLDETRGRITYINRKEAVCIRVSGNENQSWLITGKCSIDKRNERSTNVEIHQAMCPS